jgi:predicted RNase H-like HicB family nuclease
MTYRVVLIESDEGFSVSCPALKGCHSQGATKAEALENIRDAIREWLAGADAEKAIFTVTEEEVTV